MACVYWVDILYILIAQAPDRDVLTGQKPDGPDQGIAILKTGIYPVLSLKGVALSVKAIHSSRLRQNNEENIMFCHCILSEAMDLCNHGID